MLFFYLGSCSYFPSICVSWIMKCYSFIIHIWQINILRMLWAVIGVLPYYRCRQLYDFFFFLPWIQKLSDSLSLKRFFYRWNTPLTIFLDISKLKLDEWEKPCRHTNCRYNLEKTRYSPYPVTFKYILSHVIYNRVVCEIPKKISSLLWESP